MHEIVPCDALMLDRQIVREVSQALLADHDLDDDLFARAQAELGNGVLSEVITLIGYYELLAMSLRVWRTPLPEGTRREF